MIRARQAPAASTSARGLVGRDPACMSPEARLAEVAQVIAVGLRRLQLRGPKPQFELDADGDFEPSSRAEKQR